MVIPAVMLAVLALVAIRALMGVVAHDDAATNAMALPAEPARAVWGDEARSLLLPAASEHIDLAQPDVVDTEANAS
jgi:hypothetical protein